MSTVVTPMYNKKVAAVFAFIYAFFIVAFLLWYLAKFIYRGLTPEQKEKVAARLKTSLEAGAVGVSGLLTPKIIAFIKGWIAEISKPPAQA